MPNSFIVAHITDLHIGSQFDKAWIALSKTLSNLSPNLIIISGDITDSNEESNFRLFLDWIKGTTNSNDSTPAHGLGLGEGFADKVFIVPGNHDHFLYKYLRVQSEQSNFFKVFKKEILPKWQYVEGENQPGLFLVGLDSYKSHWPANGRVKKSDLDLIRECCDQGRNGLLKKNGDYLGLSTISTQEDASKRFTEAYKILVLHHYLFLPNSRGTEFFMSLDNRREVLARIAINDFDMVVCGHDHRNMSNYRKYDDLLDKRALRRFARMYCVRQCGISGIKAYGIDHNGRLLKKMERFACEYLMKSKDLQDLGFLGNFDKKTIRKGVKDFIVYDLSDPSTKNLIKQIASLFEEEILTVLQCRSMVQCIAPTATIKSKQDRNGFFVYHFHRERKVDVERYFLTQNGSEFIFKNESNETYALWKPIDSFSSKVHLHLNKYNAAQGVLSETKA